jgi:hypothetical protein
VKTGTNQFRQLRPGRRACDSAFCPRGGFQNSGQDEIGELLFFFSGQARHDRDDDSELRIDVDPLTLSPMAA